MSPTTDNSGPLRDSRGASGDSGGAASDRGHDRLLRADLHRVRDGYRPDQQRMRARFDRAVDTEAGSGSDRRRTATGRRSPTPLLARAAVVLVLCGAAVGLWQTVGDRSGRNQVAGVGAAAGGGSVSVSSAGGTADATVETEPGTRPPAQPPTTSTAGSPDQGSSAPDPTMPPGSGSGSGQPVNGGLVTTATTPSNAGGSATSAATPAAGAGTQPATTPPVGAGGRDAGKCRHNDTIVEAPYYVINDLWGTVDQPSSGSQCIDVTSFSAGNLAWSTQWSWPTGPGQVKSFSSMALGWHWGWKLQGTGLPRAMADRPGLRARWDFTVAEQTPGHMEVAYDLWFHDTPAPGGNDLPTSEVRILLYQSPRQLPGAGRVSTVTVEGGTYDVYLSHDQWDVLTFYRTGPSTSSDMDLENFLDLARQRVRLSYLTSVHAGVGVVDGSGRVDTTRFSLKIS